MCTQHRGCDDRLSEVECSFCNWTWRGVRWEGGVTHGISPPASPYLGAKHTRPFLSPANALAHLLHTHPSSPPIPQSHTFPCRVPSVSNFALLAPRPCSPEANFASPCRHETLVGVLAATTTHAQAATSPSTCPQEDNDDMWWAGEWQQPNGTLHLALAVSFADLSVHVHADSHRCPAPQRFRTGRGSCRASAMSC